MRTRTRPIILSSISLVLLSTVVVLDPRTADAALISAADDPALEGALQSDLSAPVQKSPQAVVFSLLGAAGNALITATGGADPPFYSCSGGVCRLVSSTYPPAPLFPVKLEPDRPVDAIAIELVACKDGYAIAAQASDQGTNRSERWPAVGYYPCPASATVVGIGGIGNLTRVELEGGLYSGNQWRSLYVHLAETSAPVAIDLGLSPPAKSMLGPSQNWSPAFVLHNASTALAKLIEVVVLSAPWTPVQSTVPTATFDGERATFAIAELAAGQSAILTVASTTPSRDRFNCRDVLLAIGLPRAPFSDPDPSNNVAVAQVGFDPDLISAQEDCISPWDDDCDGLPNCLDPDCTKTVACTPQQVFDAEGPGDPGPGTSNPPPCTRYIHGEEVSVPAYCCDPDYPKDAVNYQTHCVPLDPNAIEAESPRVNARGRAHIAAGQIIQYRVHYENIGGTDAHDVQTIVVLDPNLDDTTLVINDGGTYDPATRTLRWIDPAVFPHDPRSVTYAVALRKDANYGTGARAYATIVFPDAVPPTRLDTNVVEHKVPNPASSGDAIPVVDHCEVGTANQWYPVVTNQGWGFAYAPSIKILSVPTWVQVLGSQTSALGSESGRTPTERVLLPLTSVRAEQGVTLEGADPDRPCAGVTWQVEWTTATGQAAFRTTTTGEAAPSMPADLGAPDRADLAPSSGPSVGQPEGCACQVATAAPAVGWQLVFAILGLFVVRRTRFSRGPASGSRNR